MKLNKNFYNEIADIKSHLVTSFPKSSKGKGLVNVDLHNFVGETVCLFCKTNLIDIANNKVVKIIPNRNVVICPTFETDERGNVTVTITNESFYSNYNLDNPDDSNIVKDADIKVSDNTQVTCLAIGKLSYNGIYQFQPNDIYAVVPVGSDFSKGYEFILNNTDLKKDDVIVNKFIDTYTGKFSLFGKDPKEPNQNDTNYIPYNFGQSTAVKASNDTSYGGTNNSKYLYSIAGNYKTINKYDITSNNNLLNEVITTPENRLADLGYSMDCTDKHLLVGSYTAKAFLLFDIQDDGSLVNERIIKKSSASNFFGAEVKIFDQIIMVSDQTYKKVYIYDIQEDGSIGNERILNVNERNFGKKLAIHNKTISILSDSNVHIYDIQDDGSTGNERKAFNESISLNSMDMYNNTIVASSDKNKKCYVFDIQDDGSLSEKKEVSSPDSDHFGTDVAINNDIMIIVDFNNRHKYGGVYKINPDKTIDKREDISLNGYEYPSLYSCKNSFITKNQHDINYYNIENL